MAVLALAGCAAQEALLAAQARRSLPGLSESDLHFFAGVPDRVAETTGRDRVARQYWTYQRTPSSSSGITVNLPVIGGASASAAAGTAARPSNWSRAASSGSVIAAAPNRGRRAMPPVPG